MLALCDNMVEMQDTLVGYPIYPSLHHALVPITWPLSRCESYRMALGLVDYTTNNGVEAFNRVIKCGTSLPTPTPTATPHRHPPTGSSTNLPTPFNVPLTTACLTDCLVQSAHTLGTAELARHLTYTILVTYNERRWQKMCTGVIWRISHSQETRQFCLQQMSSYTLRLSTDTDSSGSTPPLAVQNSVCRL